MHPPQVRSRALTMLASGLSISAVSRELGVSRWCVRDWSRHGTQPRRRSGDACFRCDDAAPPDDQGYALLLGYYLGDGCISEAARTCSLRVSCDARYPGVVADVRGALLAVHPTGPVSVVRAPGVLVVQNWWKHWPCLFPQHGPGLKHTRELTLAGWQRRVVERHPAAFLRGLFHSDGCRVVNSTVRLVAGERKRYLYPRWQFTNTSDDIRGWCTEALDRVARLDELIGPKN